MAPRSCARTGTSTPVTLWCVGVLHVCTSDKASKHFTSLGFHQVYVIDLSQPDKLAESLEALRSFVVSRAPRFLTVNMCGLSG